MATAALDDTIRSLLTTRLTWAVVGCSPSPHRDSHRIADLLRRRGNRILPVHPPPAGAELLGHRSVASAPARGHGPPDSLHLFPRPAVACAHVDEAIAIGAR